MTYKPSATKWVVVYSTHSEDIYSEEFTSEKKMRKFLDGAIEDYKAIIIKTTGKVEIEDRT